MFSIYLDFIASDEYFLFKVSGKQNLPADDEDLVKAEEILEEAQL